MTLQRVRSDFEGIDIAFTFSFGRYVPDQGTSYVEVDQGYNSGETMAQRVHMGRGPWEYDAPMYHDFEQSSTSYDNCSVDKWFDTSATKGLRSPVSGSDKENRSVQEEVTSKVSTSAPGMRKALGNVTNTIQMMDPVVGREKTLSKAKVVSSAVVRKAETVRCTPKVAPPPSVPVEKETRVVDKDVKEKVVETTARRPVTRSQKKQASLTVPKSPRLLSRLRSDLHRKVVKSSEELELEEIERKRMAIQSRKARKNPAEKRKDAGIERPAKKTRIAIQHDTSLANVAGSFCVGKAIDSGSSKTRKKSSRPKLTMPKSPNFATTRRARPPRFKSTEELELEMIAKIKFKARPMNKSVISRVAPPKSGPKQGKSLTVPEPFSFATDKRAKQSSTHRQADSSSVKPFVFGGGPVTRSKAKHIVTVGTRKKESHKPVAVDPAPVLKEGDVPEKLPMEPQKTAQPQKSTQVMPVVRPVTRGSLLRGGAMRVVRKDDDVFESPPEEDRIADDKRVEESIEKDDVNIATIEYEESATFTNPLFRP